MINRFIIAIKIGIEEIFNNKMRSFLSVFAISIGVFTFLFVFSAINYSRTTVKEAMELGGANSFTFDLWDDEKLKFDMNAFEELAKKLPEVKLFSPYTSKVGFDISLDNKIYSASFIGITPNWKENNWVYGTVQGRFINWDDILLRRRVAVFVREPLSNKDKVNDWASSNYGGGGRDKIKDLKWLGYNKHMLGKQVKVRGQNFTIVGVINAPHYKDDKRLNKESVDFLVPITALSEVAWFERYIRNLYVETHTESQIKPTKEKIITYFRMREGDRNKKYHVKTFKEVAENMLESMRKNILLISILGLIAMISGGIGIMNVVLATIYARTKEIGTRRALGASKLDIFMQFSIESIVLSLFGACAGYLISIFALDYASKILGMQTSLNIYSVLLAFSIAALTGFLFSLYPSLKAANMNPVDALKVE